MNIRFCNLGRIKETELDLKPLTIIIGPNNTNKTYIAYSVYGLWQSMEHFPRSRSVQFQNENNGSLSVKVETLRRNFTAGIKKSVDNFTEELESFFQDSSGSLFSDTHYEVGIPPEEFDAALQSMLGEVIGIREKYRISIEKDLLVLSPLITSVNESKDLTEETRVRRDSSLDVGFMLDLALRQQLVSHPYLLPAERNAFVITYKVLANRRLKLMLDAQRRLFSSRQSSKRQLDLLREAGEVRYPQPVEDFLEFLFEVESEIIPTPNKEIETVSRQRPGRRRPAQRKLGELANDIEQNIQNGNRINFRPTALGGQEIMVDVGNGLNIDLYNASSSTKQLAPLLLYLRYRAAKRDLLIIDEPEMNLHPESQAKLLEVLAMLVNAGVYVLLTTHSPYLMSHLNNLAQSEETTATARRRQSKSLYLGNPASLLHMDQISAYEMRDAQLHSLKDPDYGIRWDTLSDVSTELQQKFFNIHE